MARSLKGMGDDERSERSSDKQPQSSNGVPEKAGCLGVKCDIRWIEYSMSEMRADNRMNRRQVRKGADAKETTTDSFA